MGQARSLRSMSKYLTPESIKAGAMEAERDMRAYARSEAAKTAKLRAKQRLSEQYKRASSGLMERNARLSKWVNKQ